MRSLAMLLLLAACSGSSEPSRRDPAPPVVQGAVPPGPAPAGGAGEHGEPGAAPPPPLDGGVFAEASDELRALMRTAPESDDPIAAYDGAKARCGELVAAHPELRELRPLCARVSLDELAMTQPGPARAAELRAEARAQYEALLELESDSAIALEGLADVHMVAHTPEDSARAVELFERALAGRPDDPVMRLRLGEALQRLDRYHEAETSLQAALVGYEAAGNERGVVNAKNLLGRLYLEQERLEEAERMLAESAAGLETLEDKSSYYGCPYQALGALYHQTGRQDESVEAMKRLAELEPHSVDSQLLAAKACRELGDEDCAAHYQARAEALRQR